MRVSGLVLVVLALGHLCITHILNNVEVINYAFVANRWANPRTGVVWRVWDLLMVNLAVLHGFNGLRQVLWEYVGGLMTRKVVATVLWGCCAFLIGLGTYAILLFNANKDYLDRFYSANPRLQPVAYERAAEPAPAR